MKNNITFLQSMLGILARREGGGIPKHVMDKCESRLISMGMIHDLLSRSDTLERLNAGDYISSLARMIHENHRDLRPGVALQLDLEDIEMNEKLLTTCGMIISELLTNALKHAFEDGDRGVVWVGMKRGAKGRGLIFIRDDGKGIPEDMELEASASTGLGMQIIASHIEQINGELKVIRDKGTEFRMTFPLTEAR
jgi:two-component sensor histidine kinase